MVKKTRESGNKKRGEKLGQSWAHFLYVRVNWLRDKQRQRQNKSKTSKHKYCKKVCRSSAEVGVWKSAIFALANIVTPSSSMASGEKEEKEDFAPSRKWGMLKKESQIWKCKELLKGFSYNFGNPRLWRRGSLSCLPTYCLLTVDSFQRARCLAPRPGFEFEKLFSQKTF